MRLRSLLAIAFATVAIGVLPTSSASAVSYGINFRNFEVEDLEFVKGAGATVYRAELDFTCTAWGTNWGQFDPVIEAAWKRGITILPILVRSVPACNNATYKGFLASDNPNWGAWGVWARTAVERYGINGSFWAGKSNPTPITAWEVGNEPNLKVNNPDEIVVQPEAYGEFLKYTWEAIQSGAQTKTAQNTTVLVGGLNLRVGGTGEDPAGMYAGTFLQKMKNTPYYTAVAIHPYAFYPNSLSGIQQEVEDIRAQLTAQPGGAGKALWITELGWPVPPGSGGLKVFESTVSEAEQATLLNQTFDWLETKASSYQIPLITWYKIQDQTAEGPHWDEHTGLRRIDGSFRPAWYAFQAQAGAPSWPPPRYPDELGFVRYNASSTHLDTYVSGPTYKTLVSSSDTAYPKITDPQNVRGMALDTNGDGIDGLAFLRFNPAGANTHLDFYTGEPNFKTLSSSCSTGYPKVTDPQNVEVLPIESSSAVGEELGFIRYNSPSSASTHLDTYTGAPCYQTLKSVSDTGYPKITDPQNVQALALDTNGDGIDELGFLRLNSPGNAHLDAYRGAPEYKTSLASCDTGYPTVSDPENVQALAIDNNGDGIDELGFLRFNPATLNTHLDLYAGGPCYKTLISSSDVAYPKVTDPENVQALAINWNTTAHDPGPQWGGESIGGEIASDPDISSWGSGRLDVFAKGPSGTIQHRAFDGGAWHGWDVVPNSAGTTSGPGAASWGSGRIDLAAQKGSEGAVHHWWYDASSGKWNDDPLGGKISSDPDLAAWGPNRLDVFARGSTPALEHRAWDVSKWYGWETIPNSSGLGSGPGAVSWGSGRLDMVGRDEATGKVRHWWFDASVGTWNAEALWTQQVGSDPDISSWGPNRLDVFAKGPEDGLIHKFWNGAGWSGWESLGGPALTSGPGAVSWGKNRIDVVARVAGNNLYHWYYVDP